MTEYRFTEYFGRQDHDSQWIIGLCHNGAFKRHQGFQQYLWRAVDQDGDVIDILLQPRRDRRAAERFFSANPTTILRAAVRHSSPMVSAPGYTNQP